MIRFFASSFLLLFLLIFEFSFVHALPEPFLYAPVVLACGLYLFQHLGSPIGAWWLFGLGVWLDFWQLGVMPAETLVYAAAALLMIFLGRRFFTNRSLYGVIGNATLTLFFIEIVQAVYLAGFLLNQTTTWSWWSFVLFVVWQFIFLVLLVSLLFFLAKRIRLVLKSLLIVPARDGL